MVGDGIAINHAMRHAPRASVRIKLMKEDKETTVEKQYFPFYRAFL